jgi:hypothetical protein
MEDRTDKPSYRRLRSYPLDPSPSTDLAAAVMNEATLKVPRKKNLKSAPDGEYPEVISDLADRFQQDLLEAALAQRASLDVFVFHMS